MTLKAENTEIRQPVAENTVTLKAQSKYPTKEVFLKRSSVTVTIPQDWTVEDTMKSQAYGKGDPIKTTMALIQNLCRFNGEKWTITDIRDKITGRDFTLIQGEMYSDDEDEEKN